MEIQLRLVLLIVGVLILLVVAIDIYRRRPLKDLSIAGSPPADFKTEDLCEPALNLYDVEHELELDLAHHLAADTTESNVEEDIPKRIISISILARTTNGFDGDTLLKALHSAHLYFGKYDIFHRHEQEDGRGTILFSLLKAVEPGYFYIDTLAQERIQGVTLVLLPDELVNPLNALDKLVRTAKQMAFALNGELLDENKQPLTLATLEAYRAQAYRR